MKYICKKCGKIFRHPRMIERHYVKTHKTPFGRVYKAIRINQHYITR